MPIEIDSPLLSPTDNPFDVPLGAHARREGMPEAGLHLSVGRVAGALEIGYRHHGIYLGLGSVVHFAGGPGHKSKVRARITTTSIDDFTHGEEVFVVGVPASGTFSASVICANAISKLNTADYTLLGNNCEHFATWCRSGKHRSSQVRRVVGGITSVVGGIAAGYFLRGRVPTGLARGVTRAAASSHAFRAGIVEPEPFRPSWTAPQVRPTPVWLGSVLRSPGGIWWSWMPAWWDAACRGPYSGQGTGNWVSGLIGQAGAEWRRLELPIDQMRHAGDYWAGSDGNVYVKSTSGRWQRYGEAPWRFIQQRQENL